jgi:hypothetical protein
MIEREKRTITGNYEKKWRGTQPAMMKRKRGSLPAMMKRKEKNTTCHD